MESYNSRIGKKLAVFIATVLFLLFLPIGIAKLFYGIIPDTAHTINPHYLTSDGQQFRLQGFKENVNVKSAVLSRANTPKGLGKKILFYDHEGRWYVFQNDTGEVEDLTLRLHTSSRKARLKSNVTVTGYSSMGYSHKTTFSDGTYIQTKPGVVGAMQVFAPMESQVDIEDLLTSMDIFQEREDLTRSMKWLIKNKFPVGIAFLLTYSLIWVLGILLGGEWAAKVTPEKGTPVKALKDLKNEILAMNALDIPFKFLVTGPETLSVVWREDEKWKELLEDWTSDTRYSFNIRFREKNHSVSVMETFRTVHEHRGFLKFFIFAYFSRSISIFVYRKDMPCALKYNSGKLVFTGRKFTADLQEVRNPLIEMCVFNGWSYNPKVTFL